MPLADHIEAETGWRSAWPLPESVPTCQKTFKRCSQRTGSPPRAAPSVTPSNSNGRARGSARTWGTLLQSAEDELFDLIEYFHRHVSEGEDHRAQPFTATAIAAGTTRPSTRHLPKPCSGSA